MIIKLIEDINEFGKISNAWDKSVLRYGEDNPFLLSDFIKAWWRFFSKDKRLFIVAYFNENNEIVGGIPLYRKKSFFKDYILYIGGADANLTHAFCSSWEFNLFDSLLERIKDKQWDILVLDRLLVNNMLITQLQRSSVARSGELDFNLISGGVNGAIDLTFGLDHILSSLPERLRRYLKSSKSKASSKGGLLLERVNGELAVNALFEQYLELSIRSFSARGIKSLAMDNRWSGFNRELLCAFDKKKMLDAHRLSMGKEVLATSFGYRLGDTFKWILTAFNPEFKEFRPGHLLIDALLREAIGNKDRIFDMFYGADALYKRQWCNYSLPIKKIQIFRKNTSNRWLLKMENYLRSNMFFMKHARKLKSWLQ